MEEELKKLLKPIIDPYNYSLFDVGYNDGVIDCIEIVRKCQAEAVKEFAKRIIKRLFYVDTDKDGKEVKYGVLTSEEIWEIAEQFGVRAEDYDK